MISQQKVSPKWLRISHKTRLYTLIAQKNFKPHPMTFHSDDAGEIVFPVSLGGKVFAALPRGTACSMLSSCHHDIEKI